MRRKNSTSCCLQGGVRTGAFVATSGGRMDGAAAGSSSGSSFAAAAMIAFYSSKTRFRSVG